MSHEINKISPVFYSGYSLTKTEALTVGLAVTVAVAAISLAVLAFLAFSGIDISIFHALGGMGKAGTLVLMAFGTSTGTICLSYIIKKIRYHLFLSKVAFYTQDQAAIEKMIPLVKDAKQIRQHFDYLEKQPSFSRKRHKKRFMSVTDKGGDSVVMILESDGAKRAISIFLTPPELQDAQIGSDGYEEKMQQHSHEFFIGKEDKRTYIEELLDQDYEMILPLPEQRN